MESRGPAGASIPFSTGFQMRLPALLASGVKNPAPVATGMELLEPSSPGLRR